MQHFQDKLCNVLTFAGLVGVIVWGTVSLWPEAEATPLLQPEAEELSADTLPADTLPELPLTEDLPVVQEEVGMFKLSYRNRSLPASFVGNGRDESPVASAMKKYRAEAMRFAGQVMLATGYFNTRLPTEQPKTEINYTELRLSYSNGIVFYFVADRSRDGVCGCYLQRITLDGKQIYNGCFSRYSSVDDVLQKTQSNGECQNAHYHFIE